MLPFGWRRYSASLMFISLLACSACSREPDAIEQQRGAVETKARPNVLLITLDTLRADYVSCYGSNRVSTPAIDALAARGVRFAKAIVQIPLTAPSHASILTGTYPQVHKVRDMGGFFMDQDLPTLATALSEAGFETAAFVAAAVLNHQYGLDHGFATYNDQMKDDTIKSRLPGVVAEVRGETITRRALEWLDGRLQGPASAGQARPFFLWIHYYDPHFPYDPPEPYLAKHPKDPYAGEVAYTDAQVGKLLGWLSESGIQGNTLVFLLADHGEGLGDHGEFTHGVFLYESTVHVPFIAAGPGIPAGRVVPQQVRSIDVMPTILDLLVLPSGDKVQGASLKSSLLEGKEPRSNYCYMETLYPKIQHGWAELRGMRTDDYKLIIAPRPELYRFSDDPGEERNVIEKHPADSDRLQKKVWEIAGPPQSLGKIEPMPVNEERRRELDALGYVSSGRRTIYIDMSGPDPKDRVAVLAALEKASDAINRERYGEAITLLDRAMKEDPTNPMIYKQLQLCFEYSGQLDRLERICLLAIENEAASDETYANLGEIRIRRGNLSGALEYLEKAAQLNPANFQTMDNLATVYLQLGRLPDAERVLRAILAQSERHAMAHNVYGLLEVQRGRIAQARDHLEKAIRYDPNMAEPYMNLGLIAQNTGDRASAIRYYREFLDRADKEKHREVIPKVKMAIAELGG